MERAEFLKRMRSLAEEGYNHFAPRYWADWGWDVNAMHREYLQKFFALIDQPGIILSAACGAGRFDGILTEAGHSVLGIDQSAGMLTRAREHFPIQQYPRIRYQKMGMQEMPFHKEFDGLICMDAMEHICPEDWPVILRNFAQALNPNAPLYLTADTRDDAEIKACFERAQAMGLPVVYGEIADEVESAYQHALETGEVVDQCVYHYVPSLDQVLSMLAQSGLSVVEVGESDEYHHILARKGSAPAASA